MSSATVQRSVVWSIYQLVPCYCLMSKIVWKLESEKLISVFRDLLKKWNLDFSLKFCLKDFEQWKCWRCAPRISSSVALTALRNSSTFGHLARNPGWLWKCTVLTFLRLLRGCYCPNSGLSYVLENWGHTI